MLLATIKTNSTPNTGGILVTSECPNMGCHLFDEFRIAEQIGSVKLFDLFSDLSIEFLQRQIQYSAHKLGCIPSSKKIASSIADTITSPDFGGLSRCNSLLVVPPTYKDQHFATSQERLVKNVSSSLKGIEYLDWSLNFSGENGHSYARNNGVHDRMQSVRRCLAQSNPSAEIKDRDIIVIDDIWVTGSAALVTCDYLRERGARTVRYCGYTSLESCTPSEEYLLNGIVLLRRDWKAVESILTQNELPTRHLFNMVLEDPAILSIFVRDCPSKIQGTFFRLAEQYYDKREIQPPLRAMPYSNSLGNAIKFTDIKKAEAA